MMHKVKIESIEGGRAKVFIDDKPIRASKIDMHAEVGCYPETEIRLVGEPDMEYDSLITFDFSPQTVRKAVDVLKVALEKHDFIAELGLAQLNEVKK